MSENDTQSCPFCTATIPAVALKCRHCGEWVSNPVQRGAVARPSVAPRSAKSSFDSQEDKNVKIEPKTTPINPPRPSFGSSPVSLPERPNNSIKRPTWTIVIPLVSSIGSGINFLKWTFSSWEEDVFIHLLVWAFSGLCAAGVFYFGVIKLKDWVFRLIGIMLVLSVLGCLIGMFILADNKKEWADLIPVTIVVSGMLFLCLKATKLVSEYNAHIDFYGEQPE
jgi:hypothetical protein